MSGAEADAALYFVAYQYNDRDHMEGYIIDTKWKKDEPLPPVGTTIETDGGRGTITQISHPIPIFPHYTGYVTIDVPAERDVAAGGESAATSLHLGTAPPGSFRYHVLRVDGVPGSNVTLTDGDWPYHLEFPPVGSEVETKWGTAIMNNTVHGLGGTMGYANISPDGWGSPSRSAFTSR